MLRFSDFSHLSEVDELVRQLVAESSGLVLVTGLDGRQALDTAIDTRLPGFLPSGRAAIFRVLVGELLDAHPRASCRVITEDRQLIHTARRFRSRVEIVQLKHPREYPEALAAVKDKEIIVLDRVTAENAKEVMVAARRGNRVVTQLDTYYHAQSLVRHLVDLGADPEQLDGLRWVLSVQRFPTLCPICKHPADVTVGHLDQLDRLARRYPSLSSLKAPPDGGAFYAPGRCANCQFTGRRGDVAAFDFFRVDDPAALWEGASVLPMEAYIWMLAQRGQLALSDALDFENQQLRRAFHLLMNSERRETQTAAALERKLAELETANRLLKQRTRELVSLEGIGQALITWNDLGDLGTHVLKAALELCKADRGSLYYVRSAEWGQIIASHGWGDTSTGMGLARGLIYENLSDREPMEYLDTPPGVIAAADSPKLRAGLSLPLVAHGIPAGLMLIQSTRKSRFTQGEAAILSTLAGYAAIAMQRAGLIEQLQGKIDALEQAQIGLAQKERLDRELELARQVQLSMLPQTFPSVAGVEFAANYAPARQVGGDFYDVIRLDEERVALVIADVSDKGMPAALYMALTRSLILSASQQFNSPDDVLHNVNQLLLEIGEQDMFVTVFYGVLDRPRGRLTYARAGHDHPFLLREGRVEPLDGRGMALGLFDPPLFALSEEAVELRPGDRLVLYTDGLTDVNGPDGAMLGRERLEHCLKDLSNLSPSGICRELFKFLDDFRRDAPQFDDMALVVVALA